MFKIPTSKVGRDRWRLWANRIADDSHYDGEEEVNADVALAVVILQLLDNAELADKIYGAMTKGNSDDGDKEKE